MQRRWSDNMNAIELAEWQERHKLTRTTAADALGISPQQYTRMVAGNLPISLTIERLCKALDAIQVQSCNE